MENISTVFVLDKNEQSREVIKSFIEDLSFIAENLLEDSIEKIMIKAVYYYASAMDKLKSHKSAMYYIDLLFDKDIANCIDASFNDREKILINYYGITQEDYVDNDDSFYLPFMRKLREAQRDSKINQIDNAKIFE